MIEALLSPAAWGSPLGLGVFLVCLGLFINLLSVADKNEKTTKNTKAKK